VNDISAHGAIIALSLLVLLWLSMSQIGVLWNRAKEVFNEIFEDEPDWS